MSKRKGTRSIRSWALANIILQHDLFDEWRVYCYQHPKLKSAYRSANLFLLKKNLRYASVDPEKNVSVNMDSLCDYVYGD